MLAVLRYLQSPDAVRARTQPRHPGLWEVAHAGRGPLASRGCDGSCSWLAGSRSPSCPPPRARPSPRRVTPSRWPRRSTPVPGSAQRPSRSWPVPRATPRTASPTPRSAASRRTARRRSPILTSGDASQADGDNAVEASTELATGPAHGFAGAPGNANDTSVLAIPFLTPAETNCLTSTSASSPRSTPTTSRRASATASSPCSTRRPSAPTPTPTSARRRTSPSTATARW